MHDLIIRNARIVDGSGAPAFMGEVAVADGKIVAVARAGEAPIAGPAKRSIDAHGKLLTPGFVDIHTHYDGQVCWDKQLTPSCWHGVTTIVMGNCGVGFAPVRPGTESELVEIMESVEDIPGTVLHEGIPWGWESFADYLHSIDTPYVMDVGAQVPHVAVRHYVMGARCYDDATADDIAAMAAITKQALQDGALGFTTSRFYGHFDKHGALVPGTHADGEELKAIGNALAEVDHGTVEIISDRMEDPDEQHWVEWIAKRTGRPVTILATSNIGADVWGMAEKLNAQGLKIRPQVGARPASVLMSLEGTVNPMRQFGSYKDIAKLSVAEQRAKLKDPAFRARVLADTPKVPRDETTANMISTWDKMFILPTDLSYEPSFNESVAGIAAAQGIDVREALMDIMAAGRPLLYLVGEYSGSLEKQHAGIAHPHSVFGLSDGGAHCGVLCDASMPTYMLAYMSRDRVRGPIFPIEYTVHKMTRDTALVYGLTDRGLIAEGMRADLNIIDFDALALEDPEMVYDLPAGGKRLVQKARGYVATFCKGEVTYENGVHTGALPGRLLRG
ncbi:MAG: amidohydrolase family protein [Gammaproteobacteria bacterium]|nr:amidohydrolase family protein [Gammaproteobacteria bacterium]